MTRALVVRLDAVGDVLLSGPAVRAVRTGASSVTYLCGPAGAPAARLLPGIDALLVHDAPWIAADPAPLDPVATGALVAAVRAARCDVAVILGSYHQSPLPTALLLRLAGVPRLVAISEDYPGSLLDVRLPDLGDVHEVERALGTVRAAGFELPPDDDGGLDVRLPAAAEAAAPALEPGTVVVHPGASVPARAWRPAAHRALVARLHALDVPVVVTGGPGERALTRHVAAPAGPEADLGGALDLAGLAVVLRRASALVAGNTGPAHLAAAVGTPVVSLFAPTVPAARWRPWRVPHVLLGDAAVPCASCRARVCPRAGHPCLAAIGVDDVVRALARLGGRAARPLPWRASMVEVVA